MNPWFDGGEPGKVRILDNLILGDNAHSPAGKAPRISAVIVDPMGNEFRLAAENPVSPVAVNDANGLVEPALVGENADKLL